MKLLGSLVILFSALFLALPLAILGWIFLQLAKACAAASTFLGSGE